jgi:hypothetical protein
LVLLVEWSLLVSVVMDIMDESVLVLLISIVLVEDMSLRVEEEESSARIARGLRAMKRTEAMVNCMLTVMMGCVE